MSILESLKRAAVSMLKKETRKAVNNAVQNIGKGRNHTEKFTFSALPTDVDELKALPEAKLDTAFKATALTILALNRYEADPDAAIRMLNFLKGPEEFGGKEQSFLKDRLSGKGYKARSFLGGATPRTTTRPPRRTPSRSARIRIPR